MADFAADTRVPEGLLVPAFIDPPSAVPENAPRTAVLLANLGTPGAPTPEAVREYLAEFLSDPRVVELPRALWWPVLHGYVLRTRPRRSAEAYAKIWTNEGSPLAIHSTQLATAVQAELARRTAGAVTVALAMRYGSPSIEDTLLHLHDQGVRRVLLLPLYPQYAAATTGSALDAVADAIGLLRWPPELRSINDYHDDAGYLAALAASVTAHWAQHGRAQKLLLSFHGLPEASARKGDPYFNQCHETAYRLRDALGLREEDMLLSFQSRVGRQRWLRPYTDETIAELAREGVKTLDVLCPGFAVDCLETLEEIALRYRATFLTQGGERFTYIPALNASSAHATALAQLALKNLSGWI
ncbi:MAG: ferrochelatase [Proteobacteria bacterium]|nr:ferrochelatase [Pseudomonadota bacterium]